MLNNILAILLIFFTASSHAQDEKVELIITPTSAGVGEMLTITVKHNMQGEIEIDNLPASFVQGYDIVSGMESEMDYNNGTLTTYYYLMQTGYIGKSGTYTIGPAFVKAGNRTFKSNSVTIEIGNATHMTSSGVTSAQLTDPAFGIIQTSKTSIYEGEPLLILAKVYAQFDPTHLDGYQTYSMTGVVDMHAIGSANRINKTEERFKGHDYYSFEYDKNVIFPIGTGNFRINSYRMNLHQGLKGFVLTSSSANVEVKPLPPNQPLDFIGGVGVFQLDITIDEEEIEQGDVFKLTLTVSGSGNLQNILDPVPVLPKGFVVYGDPIITDEISYSSRGAIGFISYEYNVQVNKHGDLDLPPTTLSYFDPDKEKYVTISTEDHLIKVTKNESFVADDVNLNDSDNSNELLPTAELRRSTIIENSSTIYGTAIFWTGIGAPILSAFLFLLFLKRREKTEEEIEVKQTVKKRNNEFAEHFAALKVLVHSSDDNAFYSKAETTLKKAFEREMKLEDDRILNKQDIFEYLEADNREILLEQVTNFLSKCEQFRYGFGAAEEAKQEMFNQLTSILKTIKA